MKLSLCRVVFGRRILTNVVLALCLFVTASSLLKSTSFFLDFEEMMKEYGLKTSTMLAQLETASFLFSGYGGVNTTFCLEWDNVDDASIDLWWTDHPDWHVSSENDTHFCFSPMDDPEKVHFLRRLYDIQFKGNCSNVTSRHMWSSGWGADFTNIILSLQYALDTNQPTQLFAAGSEGWHYAKAKKEGSRPVCPLQDQLCYFLEISNCVANPSKDAHIETWEDVNSREGYWLYEYATRPQTWLRREIYKYKTSVPIATPCTVMHVRRSDVIFHQGASRKYHAIQEYIDSSSKTTQNKNILLLTDDQNAVEEATVLFPEYNWMYLDRPRHRGSEGGWENQIPSNDPRHEVIVILSTFELVKKCDTLVHTFGSFADYLYAQMKTRKDGATRINMDDGKDEKDVWNENNRLSENISTSFLLQARNKTSYRNGTTMAQI